MSFIDNGFLREHFVEFACRHKRADEGDHTDCKSKG